MCCGKLIYIGMILENHNKISKYILLNIDSKEVLIKSIGECVEIIDSNNGIIGLKRNSINGIIRNGWFKAHKGIIGEETSSEVFTIIRRICHRKYKEYEISDPIGKISRVTEEQLKELLAKNIRINGILQRKSGLTLAPGIETVIQE